MSKNNPNLQIQEHTLDIKSIFWKNFRVIIETVKQKTFSTINLSLTNGFFSKKISKVALSENDDWDFLLNSFTYYDDKTPINYVIKKDLLEKDLDEAVYLLTEDLQFRLLKKELDYVIWILQDSWMKVNYTREKNWANLEFQLFNIDNPVRNVTIYMADGDINYDFYDVSMTQEMMDSELSFINNTSYKTIFNWLKWDKVLLQSTDKLDKI